MQPTRRKTIRLAGYDYRAGWFFLTLCTFNRRRLFGIIAGEELHVSATGRCVSDHLWRISDHRPDCTVHEFGLMPDHLHAILEIRRSGRTGGLGSVISHFKRGVSLEIERAGLLRAGQVWQRGYFEHVIRSTNDLNQTRRYIRENVLASVEGPRIADRGARP